MLFYNIDKPSPQEVKEWMKINELEIPTGNPLVIEFEKNLEIKKCFYLDEKRAKNLFFNQ